MVDEFAQRIRSAATSAWWTVLIGAVFVTLQWLAYLAFLSSKPNWLRAMWGPDMTWATVQSVWINTIAIMKVFIWVMMLLALWLTLWSRRLRRG